MKPKVYRGTRICLNEGCGAPCEGRKQYCPTCKRKRYSHDAYATVNMTNTTRICSECTKEKDCEEFIRSTKKNKNGHFISKYGDICDDCYMQADWKAGNTTPDVEGQPPYEVVRRQLAYEYHLVPSTWINSSTGLAVLHTLLMCKLAGIRTEGIDQRIAEQRDIIRRHGPL